MLLNASRQKVAGLVAETAKILGEAGNPSDAQTEALMERWAKVCAEHAEVENVFFPDDAGLATVRDRLRYAMAEMDRVQGIIAKSGDGFSAGQRGQRVNELGARVLELTDIVRRLEAERAAEEGA